MQERRAAPRFQVELNVRWETLKSQGRGSVSDLSSTGCFVLTGGEFASGELVRLQIVTPQHFANVWGQIIYTMGEMGFALRFVFAGHDTRELEGVLRELYDEGD